METLYKAEIFLKAELSGTRMVDSPVKEEALEVRRAPAKPGLSVIRAVKLDSSG